jgi:iron complex outermembrane recepter protein
LTVGGRIASTKFSFNEVLRGSFIPGWPVTNTNKQKESPFTPKVGVAWEPNSNSLLYASASKGFRVGGANIPITPTPPCLTSLGTLGLTSAPGTFKSDSVWNYEVGGKLGLFNRMIQINASAYHIDWSNIQSFVSLSGCPGGFITNLGAANSDGFDLSISARPTDSLSASVSAGYNRSRYAETRSTNGVILTEKNGQVSDAPPWQITTTVEYSQPLGAGNGYIRAINQYSSKNKGLISKYDTPATSGYDALGERNDGFNLTSLRVGWRDGTFDVSLFADNLFNSHPQLNNISNAFPTDTTYYANTLRPRTIGLTLTARN